MDDLILENTLQASWYEQFVQLDDVIKPLLWIYPLEERQLNVTRSWTYFRLMMDRIIFYSVHASWWLYTASLRKQLLYLDSGGWNGIFPSISILGGSVYTPVQVFMIPCSSSTIDVAIYAGMAANA